MKFTSVAKSLLHLSAPLTSSSGKKPSVWFSITISNLIRLWNLLLLQSLWCIYDLHLSAPLTSSSLLHYQKFTLILPSTISYVWNCMETVCFLFWMNNFHQSTTFVYSYTLVHIGPMIVSTAALHCMIVSTDIMIVNTALYDNSNSHKICCYDYNHCILWLYLLLQCLCMNGIFHMPSSLLTTLMHIELYLLSY